MRPPVWHPPVERSSAAHAIIKRIRQAKLLGGPTAASLRAVF
jgi:hypothetical protein